MDVRHLGSRYSNVVGRAQTKSCRVVGDGEDRVGEVHWAHSIMNRERTFIDGVQFCSASKTTGVWFGSGSCEAVKKWFG